MSARLSPYVRRRHSARPGPRRGCLHADGVGVTKQGHVFWAELKTGMLDLRRISAAGFDVYPSHPEGSRLKLDRRSTCGPGKHRGQIGCEAGGGAVGREKGRNHENEPNPGQSAGSTRSRSAASANARKSRSRVRRGIPPSIQLWAINASPKRALRRFASTFARNAPARCQ